MGLADALLLVLWMCNNRNNSNQIENFDRFRLGSASGFISFKSVHACKIVSRSQTLTRGERVW